MSGNRLHPFRRWLLALALLSTGWLSVRAEDEPWMSLRAGRGPGKGKHIVFITGDEEYRSEESMPALARILAKRHGFRCTVLFSVNRETGQIDPAVADNIPGLEALKDADLAVVFTRYRHLPEDQMAHFVDYMNSGRPVIGIRTATHAFDYDRSPKERFAEWAWRGPHPKFQGGFGRQVLGETWVDHYGGYRSQGTRGIVVPGQEAHPILRGVDPLWGPSHAYAVTKLEGDSQPLLMGQPLMGLRPDDAPDPGKAPVPIAWTKTFTGTSGKAARVFTTTLGYGDDFREESIRRLLVNACYWCVGLEAKIPPSPTWLPWATTRRGRATSADSGAACGRRTSSRTSAPTTSPTCPSTGAKRDSTGSWTSPCRPRRCWRRAASWNFPTAVSRSARAEARSIWRPGPHRRRQRRSGPSSRAA
jgi:hypothetical protein